MDFRILLPNQDAQLLFIDAYVAHLLFLSMLTYCPTYIQFIILLANPSLGNVKQPVIRHKHRCPVPKGYSFYIDYLMLVYLAVSMGSRTHISCVTGRNNNLYTNSPYIEPDLMILYWVSHKPSSILSAFGYVASLSCY